VFGGLLASVTVSAAGEAVADKIAGDVGRVLTGIGTILALVETVNANTTKEIILIKTRDIISLSPELLFYWADRTDAVFMMGKTSIIIISTTS
jgi:hypothetical protein